MTSRTGTTAASRPLLRIGLHVLTAAVLGVVGWLLFALSEAAPERAAGVLLVVAAVVSAVAAVQAVRTRDSAGTGLAAGVAALLAGGVAAALLAVEGGAAGADLLLVGLLPAALGGASTAAALAERR